MLCARGCSQEQAQHSEPRLRKQTCLDIIQTTCLLPQIRHIGWSRVRSNMMWMFMELSPRTELKLGLTRQGVVKQPG